MESDLPRVLFKKSRLAILQARAANAGTSQHPGWGPWYTRLKNSIGDSMTANLVTDPERDKHMLAMLVVHIVDTTSTDAGQAAINGALALAAHVETNGVNGFGSEKRECLLTLAWAFDVLKDAVYPGAVSLTDPEAVTIGDAIIRGSQDLNIPESQKIYGVGNGDLAVVAVANMALIDHPTFNTTATENMNDALDHWYGDAFDLSDSRISYDRYYEFGGGKGSDYEFRSKAYTSWLMYAYSQAVASSTLQGSSYDPVQDEDWLKTCPEWWLNVMWRGDKDYLKIGDSSRPISPIFSRQQRIVLGMAIRYGGSFRKPSTWLYNRLQKSLDDSGEGSAKDQAYDFFIFDPTNPDNIATSPATIPAPSGVSKSQMFDRPGSYFHRDTWDIPESTIINIQAREYAFNSHDDKNVGAIQMSHKQDMTILSSGMYEIDGTLSRALGSHNNTYKRLSIAHSGTVLFSDPNSDMAHKEHYEINQAGEKIGYPSGKGGQLYRQFNDDLNVETVDKLITDDGGNAWRTCGLTDGADRMTKVYDDDRLTFLTFQARRAYLLESSFFDTGKDLVRNCFHKILIIKKSALVPTGPYIFRVVHCEAKNEAIEMLDHWHFWGKPQISTYGSGMQTFEADGFHRFVDVLPEDSEPPGNEWGRGRVSYYDPSSYSYTTVGNFVPKGMEEGLPTAGGDQQWGYKTGMGFTNYPPTPDHSIPNNKRLFNDIGQWRMEVKPKTATGTKEQDFVCAVWSESLVGSERLSNQEQQWAEPTSGTVQAPAFEFTESSTHYVMKFPSSSESTESSLFQISKTTNSFLGPDETPDSSPPDDPSGLEIEVGVVSGRITMTWDANTEPDMRQYIISKKEA